MSNNRPLFIVIASLITVLLAGCFQGQPSEKPPIHLNPNMDAQEKYKAQSANRFFADGRTMREPIPGTVARGELREDSEYFTGKTQSGELVKKNPVKMTRQLLDRGQERFNIYCSPCHDQTGKGQGIVIKKGFVPPPSLHLDRLRKAPDGHFYDVISNGIRNMPSYRHQVPVPDRWAIVAYIRALQRSQGASISDVPKDKRNALK